MKTRMGNVILVGMLIIVLITGVGEAATWITLDPPGAISTEAQGIDGKYIVGDYGDGIGKHAFIYDGVNWTTLDYPGAILTEAYDIDDGLIVGIYIDVSGSHGFVYNCGTETWTPLNYPGARLTYALGIDSGNIVGDYITGALHGFLYDGASWATLNSPYANTHLWSISGGKIVGTYGHPGSYRGVIYDGTTWTTLLFPGSSSTSAGGIDGGNIVGDYDDDHGYLYNGVTWTTLDFPASLATDAYDIDGSKVVGRYCDSSGKWHGFLYSPNQAPVVTITSPSSGLLAAVHSPVQFTGLIDDPDVGDTHAAVWTMTSESGSEFHNGTVSGASVTDSFQFPQAGIYSISLTVADAAGESDTATTVNDLPAFIVVYDPSAGFVTGGGWIDSPAYALLDSPAAGKATFGFVAKYKQGATTPEGNTEFQFQAGGFRFKSSSYEWLVIAGSKAMFKGEGYIDGMGGGFKFVLTAVDSSEDKFRIKIWNPISDDVIYDNKRGEGDDAEPTTIGGGSIVIHKK